MGMYGMNKKVIVPKRWTDATKVVSGYIIGIEKIEDGLYLGTLGIKEYLSRLNSVRYKVVYEDNGRVTSEWFYDSNLEEFNKK